MRRNKQLKSLLFFGIILILVLVTLYSGLRILESTVLFGEQSSGNTSKTITRNGVDYFPRQDITTVLLMTADMGALVAYTLNMQYHLAKQIQALNRI